MTQPIQDPKETIKVGSRVTAQLLDRDGNVVDEEVTENMTTDVGDLYYAKKGAAISVTTVTGMRYGRGTTAAAKNGAGSYITTANYTSGSAQILDTDISPNPDASMQSPGSGAGAVITYTTTWAAGTATETSGINEVVLTNASIADNAGNQSGTDTVARSVLTSTRVKTSDLQFRVIWQHFINGGGA